MTTYTQPTVERDNGVIKINMGEVLLPSDTPEPLAEHIAALIAGPLEDVVDSVIEPELTATKERAVDDGEY